MTPDDIASRAVELYLSLSAAARSKLFSSKCDMSGGERTFLVAGVSRSLLVATQEIIERRNFSRMSAVDIDAHYPAAAEAEIEDEAARVCSELQERRSR